MIDQAKFKSVIAGWIGTPWRHGQRICGHGVDCAWFIAEVAKKMGWIPQDVMLPEYPRDWAEHNSRSQVIRYLCDCADQVHTDDRQMGDVLVYKYARCANHLGYYVSSGDGIHAHVRRGVCFFPVRLYARRLVGVWRFKEVC